MSGSVSVSKNKNLAHDVQKKFASHELGSFIRKIDKDNIRDIIKEPDFEYFMNKAYDQHWYANKWHTGLGYSIRVNPHTGQKEMFVSGSEGWKDWTLNFFDSISYAGEKFVGEKIDELWEKETESPAIARPSLTSWDFYRKNRTKQLSKIAKDEGVDVVYGHSRGGAIVADMDFSGRKVGIDAAMLIAKNTEMENYQRDSLVDNVLGVSGEHNIVVESGSGAHRAYGEGDSSFHW